MTENTAYLAVRTDKAVYHDGVAHTIRDWKLILEGMEVAFKMVRPFLLTEENYEE